jgi:simple sugar transport system ATP-binding protein
MDPILEVRNVTVRFGPVVAVDDVSLALRSSAVHCIIGENGAGKSTLMRVISGFESPQTGRVYVGNRELPPGRPRAAIAAGIGMVQQHYTLVPPYTVAENVVLGREPLRMALLDRTGAENLVRDLAERFGLPIDPKARVADLPVGLKQRVELIKVLSWGARVLILDEPTAVLTPQETDSLLKVMRRMADDGRAVIFITHKLREVMSVGDDVYVLRRGRLVHQAPVARASIRGLAAAMVGEGAQISNYGAQTQDGTSLTASHALSALGTADAEIRSDAETPGPSPTPEICTPREPILHIGDLRVSDNGGVERVSGMDLDVYPGEIVCMVGVEGNGQSELVEAIAGLRHMDSGTIQINGEEISSMTVRQRRMGRLSHVPEDRLRTGVSVRASLLDNLILGFHRTPRLRRGGFIRRRAAKTLAEEIVREFDIRADRLDQLIGSLSGGNIQRAVVGRELAHEAPVVLVSQPTRGVDIRAIEMIHRKLIDVCSRGAAILVVTSDLDEAFAIGTRLVVVFRGRVVLEGWGVEMDREEVGRAMSGESSKEGIRKK